MGKHNIYYKVRWRMNDEYEVIRIEEGEDYCADNFEGIEFRGTLHECDSYIRLKEKGYID